MDKVFAAKAAVAKAQNQRTVDLSSHVPGTPYKYKHGWVPLEHSEKLPGSSPFGVEKGGTGWHSVRKGNTPGESSRSNGFFKTKTAAHADALSRHNKAAAIQKAESTGHVGDANMGDLAARRKTGELTHISKSMPNTAEGRAAQKELDKRAKTPQASFGPTREQMIHNAEVMYGSDRSKWSVAGLTSAVKMGDTRSSAELLKRANKVDAIRQDRTMLQKAGKKARIPDASPGLAGKSKPGQLGSNTPAVTKALAENLAEYKAGRIAKDTYLKRRGEIRNRSN